MEIKFFKNGKIVKKKRRLFFYCKVKAMNHNSMFKNIISSKVIIIITIFIIIINFLSFYSIIYNFLKETINFFLYAYYIIQKY